jgi:LmbE family N-acetylglucosaminyl deacetylase
MAVRGGGIVKLPRAFLAFFGFFAAVLAPAPASAQSLPETVEAIDHARVATRILFITAHPDDEWPSLLTYLSRGRGADVALLTITRGQGGQNALGPEQGDELGVIRTQELLAADKIYGVKQYFTRAEDFGFSKSAEETLKIWDGVALEDMVRVIRTFRPQIVINGWGGVHSGHGQHQASGILTPRAVAQAADPKAFPGQIAEGLPAWKTPLLLEFARGDSQNALRIPTDEISPLWGRTYIEMGIEGRSQHRSQGTPAASFASFFHQAVYLKIAGESREKKQLDSVDLAEPLPSLAHRFPALQSVLEPVLSQAAQQIEASRQAALELNWPAAAKELAQAGSEIENLSKQLSGRGVSETTEALWELEQVRSKIDQALTDVMALHFGVRADRHELVVGESFSVSISHDAPRVGSVKIQTPGLELPAGWAITNEKTIADGAQFTVSISADAKPPHSPEDAVLPWPPPLVHAVFQAGVDGYAFTVKEPAVSVQATSTEVLTYPLDLVPAVSLTVEPRQIMLPEKDLAKTIQLLARVRYHGTLPADVVVGLDVPADWRVESVASLHFTEPRDQLARFVVTPPAHPTAGAYALKPYARLGASVFRESVEPIPTLPTRNWTEPADAAVHVLDLIVPKPLIVGYVAAGNDLVPDFLRQLGIEVDLLEEVALAFDDLRRFDAIVIGIRAYELRPDVARSNARLLRYVTEGGTLVVQYQHADVWNSLHPAPFPASMTNPAARVTDENSPVRFVDPSSPLLNFPNHITLDDFKGWVQERGLYFWSTFDPRYQPVLALQDPDETEALGGLVYARDGKGLYIYTGLSFFRELPAGVPGAYRLFVNLLSQSKAPSDSH